MTNYTIIITHDDASDAIASLERAIEFLEAHATHTWTRYEAEPRYWFREATVADRHAVDSLRALLAQLRAVAGISEVA